MMMDRELTCSSENSIQCTDDVGELCTWNLIILCYPNKFNNKGKINKNNANDLECLSLAIGKSKDVTITSQLLLIRDVNDKFQVTGDLCMNSLFGTNTGENNFKEVEKTLEVESAKMCYDLRSYTYVQTRKGFSFLKVHEACEDVKYFKPKVTCYISHQKVLCRSY